MYKVKHSLSRKFTVPTTQKCFLSKCFLEIFHSFEIYEKSTGRFFEIKRDFFSLAILPNKRNNFISPLFYFREVSFHG